MIRKKITSVVFLAILLFFTGKFSAQEKVFNGDPDTAFKVARELAFNGKRKQAQDSLLFILTKYPNYLDIRAFLGSTYSWDGKYAKARNEFAYVLDQDKERKTDWIAYVKNEQYAEKYFKSLELVQKALLVFPGDADLLQLKAKAELNSNNSQEALITMEKAVKLHPDNEEVLNYKNSLESDLSFNTISVDYSLEVYQNKDRDNMHYTTVQYARQTKYGSINAKINYTNRFLTDNYQLEIDLYPRIVKGLYAYVSGGWSQSPLNPSARYGAELFKSLPKSFEASLGFRWLKFSTETTIYTGSLGWYTGNSYWALRSYVTPGFPGTSASGRLIYRKYRSDAQNYFNVEIGYGASPAVDRFIPNRDDLVIQDYEIFRLDSQSINFGYFLTSKSKKNVWGFTTGVFREEKPFAKGDYFLFGTFGISYGVRFK